MKQGSEYQLVESAILVVEDDITNQILMKKLLSKLGFACTVVSDGLAAMEEAGRKHYHLFFLDMAMSGSDGWMVAENLIKKQTPQKPLMVALVAHTSAELQARLLAAGISDWLVEPFKLPELKAIIEKWIPPAKANHVIASGGHINLQSVYEIADDDEEFVKEIISNFLSISPPKIDTLIAALQHEDAKEIIYICHTLKGTFKFVGANELGDLMHDLETRSRLDEPVENWEVLAERIRSMYDDVYAELSNILNKML